MTYRILTSIAFIGSVAWLAADPGFEPAIAGIASIAARFRDELHAFIGSHVLSLTPRSAPVRALTHSRYSFSQPPFINPMIVADLYDWISDVGDQIVSVNVRGSNESNRYHADEVSVTDLKPNPRVTARRDQSSFAYQYIGCSYSGVHLLRVWDSSEGTGVFGAILLVTLSAESAVDIDTNRVKRAERLIIKKIGAIPLGDRYEGEISYRLGLLTIGECKGRQSLRTRKQRLLIV